MILTEVSRRSGLIMAAGPTLKMTIMLKTAAVTKVREIFPVIYKTDRKTVDEFRLCIPLYPEVTLAGERAKKVTYQTTFLLIIGRFVIYFIAPE